MDALAPWHYHRSMYVIIAGGGALGRELAEALIARRHDVVVIDRDKNTCEAIYSQLGAVTVLGDATDLHVLQDAGAERASLLVTVMPNDADNIACTLLARTLGVERIIARLRDNAYAAAYEAAGADHLIRTTHLLRNQVVLYIEHPVVNEIVMIGDDAAQIFSVSVPPTAWCIGRSAASIAAERKFPEGCLLIGIRRKGVRELVIPRGETRIRTGDTVLVIAGNADIDRAVAVLTRKG